MSKLIDYNTAFPALLLKFKTFEELSLHYVFLKMPCKRRGKIDQSFVNRTHRAPWFDPHPCIRNSIYNDNEKTIFIAN